MKLPIFKRIFSRKTLIRLAFALVVLITLVMIFYRIEMWRGERADTVARASKIEPWIGAGMVGARGTF